MNLKLQVNHNKLIAITIGIVYLWFGTLKYFPHISPAEDLAKNTIDILTFNLIPSNVSIVLLAIWETFIGICMILNVWRRTIIIVALTHMAFTFSPLFFFPDQVFENVPFHLTLLGQYILKNLIIVAGLLALYRRPAMKAKLP